MVPLITAVASSVARVQFKSGSAVYGKQVVLALNHATTSGNSLVVAVTDYYGSADPDSTISDDAGNTWNVAVNYVDGARVKVDHATNIIGSTAPIVTVQTPSPAYLIVTVVEYSGIVTASPVDGTLTNRATSATFAAGPLVTTQPEELLFGVHHAYGTNAGFSPATGWATIDLHNGGPYHQHQVQDRVVTSSGSSVSGGTLASPADVQGVVVAFRAATDSGDSEQPSTPTGLSGTVASDTQLDLTWSPSTDNVQVIGYRVFRDGVFIRNTAVTSFTDTGLVPTTTYTYSVIAYDGAGNQSTGSAPYSLATSAPQGGARVVRWTRMPRTAGWPGYVGWTVPFYDPISGQTLYYGSIPGAQGIFATDVYAYHTLSNTFTHVVGTGSLGNTCLADRPGLPGDHHPVWQMAIDTKRKAMWRYSGANRLCNPTTVNTNGTSVTFAGDPGLVSSFAPFEQTGTWNGLPVIINGNSYTVASVTSSTQLTLTSSAGVQNTVRFEPAPPNTNARTNTYYMDLNADPSVNRWHQIRPPTIPGHYASALVYDPDSDVLFAYGTDPFHANWVFCPVDDGRSFEPTGKQLAAGCQERGNWREIAVVGGIQPPAIHFVGMVYDPITKKAILHGGFNSAGAIPSNETWAYDIPTRTWQQKAIGVFAPPPNSRGGHTSNLPAMAYDPIKHTILLHQVDGTGAPADWEYDPVLETWTKLVTIGGGPTGDTTLAYDVVNGVLVTWSQPSDTRVLAEVWQGIVSDAGPDSEAPTPPGQLTASTTSNSGIALSWPTSTDNVAVVRYNISRDGTSVATTTTTSYIDGGLLPGTSYTYTVTAVDGAGNSSSPSPPQTATTFALDQTPPRLPLPRRRMAPPWAASRASPGVARRPAR